MSWHKTQIRSGLKPFLIATDKGKLRAWGFLNGHIGAHSPEDDGCWNFIHIPTGIKINKTADGPLRCSSERADYMTYQINHEAVNLDSTDLMEVRTALSEWAAPLSVAEKLKELAE